MWCCLHLRWYLFLTISLYIIWTFKVVSWISIPWGSNTCQNVSESWPVGFWAFIFLFFAPSPHPQPLIPGVPSWVQAIWLSSPCNGAKVSNCKVQPQWPTTLSNYMVTNYRAQVHWAKHVVGNYRVQLQAVPNESVQLLKLTDCQITVEKWKGTKSERIQFGRTGNE